MINNKYLKEWIDEEYPLMGNDENCLIELDFYDMDKFSDWLVKKLTIPVVVVPKGTLCVCDKRSPFPMKNLTDWYCTNCGREIKHNAT
jgi:hypothetical protein